MLVTGEYGTWTRLALQYMVAAVLLPVQGINEDNWLEACPVAQLPTCVVNTGKVENVEVQDM